MSSNALSSLSTEDTSKQMSSDDTAGDSKINGNSNGGYVRLVTIAGKQVELKYETLRKNYDIYGLHAKQRRNNAAIKTGRNRETKSAQSTIRTNSVDDRNSVDTNGSNISLEDSSASSQNSKQTNDESPKISKILRKFESYDRTLSKNSEMDRIAGSKMKKEPVKIENRFDMLSIGTEDDANKLNGDKKKKKRRKKSKLGKMNSNGIDDSIDGCESAQTSVGQSSAKIIGNSNKLITGSAQE